jgi:hypothetical protein
LTLAAEWVTPRRVIRRAALVATAFLGLASAAYALPPFSTTAKTSPASGAQAALSSVAAGCHSGYDRFVIRVGSGGKPGYDVRYVSQIIADPSGNPVSLLGTKRLRVIVRNATAHTLPGTLTPGCSNLRQVKKAGDFEGVVSFGLGLRRKSGFRVFRLTAPARIVIDVVNTP